MKAMRDSNSQPLLLLVDDDRLVLATLSQGLAGAGYAVNTAESADEAEALLAGGERPDLAVLDVSMSGKSGLELAAKLHNFDHIPFILLSAYSDPAIVEQAAASARSASPSASPWCNAVLAARRHSNCCAIPHAAKDASSRNWRKTWSMQAKP